MPELSTGITEAFQEEAAEDRPPEKEEESAPGVVDASSETEQEEVPSNILEASEPAPVKPKKKTPKKKSTAKVDYAKLLADARESINAGNVEAAMDMLEKLIKRGKFVEEIIVDLQAALVKHPIDISLWQTLGDAFMRIDNLQDALDSYSRAEDLLR